MMKKLQLLIMALIVGSISVNAQMRDVSPVAGGSTNSTNALFDLLFTIDSGVAIGAQSQAGIAFINGQYWVSNWNADTIHLLDEFGNFVETFIVPGITGTRSITTDGTWVFIGTASTIIYRVDPVTKTVDGTIPINVLPSDAEARMLTYDATLDGGSGGFWIGDFGSDIASITMFGTPLTIIPGATHGLAVYGGAIDNVSPGGPFLWIHDQSGTAPSRDFVTQLDPATGAPTGVQYDFTVDGAGAGATEVLAGGLFISDEVSPSAVAIVGLCQCSPSNLIFALELVEILGVNDSNISDFTLFPNPSSRGIVNINTSGQGDKQVVVMDILGKTVINTVISGTELNVSSLVGGVYMVQVTQNSATATKKLIIK